MQTHLYASKPTYLVTEDSEHVEPFIDGEDAHSSISVWQLKPVTPAGHVHLYSPKATDGPDCESEVTQVAAFMHGDDLHSSTSTLHVYPLKPTGHLHENTSSPWVQVAAF